MKIRKRFSDEMIAELTELKWWDLDIEIISAHIDVIVNGDIEKLRRIKNPK